MGQVAKKDERQQADSSLSSLVLFKSEKRVHKEEDFYGWLREQAQSLRDYAPVDSRFDWVDLAEELEGMAHNEERGFRSHLEVLLTHLLKWKYQPHFKGHSWEVSIANARQEIGEYLQESPSLKSKLQKSIDLAYKKARRNAGSEMGWDKQKQEATLPLLCPWEENELLDEDFFPMHT